MKVVLFIEPVPGKEKDGTGITATDIHVISQKDAIRIQRGIAQDMQRSYLNDKHALQDFMTVHWAELVDVTKLPERVIEVLSHG